jgi:two-component system OmpR family sensor kinase
MPQRVKTKWRPPLALVIGGTLAAVLCLPAIGLVIMGLTLPIYGWGVPALVVGAGIVICTCILGYLLRRLLLRPVHTLTDRARAITEGEGDARSTLPYYGTAELYDLGQSVLAMGQTLQSRAGAIRAYTDHVTHELKSPLTTIAGAAELLEAGAEGRDKAQLIIAIVTASARMQALLDDLRRLTAARDGLAQGETQLSEVMRELTAAHPGLAVTIAQDGKIAVPHDALSAILTQLLQNAQAHGATVVTLTFDSQRLHISDNGSGIAAGNRSRIFDPFFTTHRDRGGTGMGLCIVRAMLDAADAEIKLVDSAAGAAFEIIF